MEMFTTASPPCYKSSFARRGTGFSKRACLLFATTDQLQVGSGPCSSRSVFLSGICLDPAHFSFAMGLIPRSLLRLFWTATLRRCHCFGQARGNDRALFSCGHVACGSESSRRMPRGLPRGSLPVATYGDQRGLSSPAYSPN